MSSSLLQEIQNVSFEKAVFGGYDMKSVDCFLEKISDSVSSLQKEIITLKSKMKLLVDKVEEYRSVEESMRKALISAQNIANEIVENAEADAQGKISEYKNLIFEEKQQFNKLRQSSHEFVKKLISFYQKEMDQLCEFQNKDQEPEDGIESESAVDIEHTEEVYGEHNSQQTKEIDNLIKNFTTSAGMDIKKPFQSMDVGKSPKLKIVSQEERSNNDDMKMKVFEVTLGGPKGCEEGTFDDSLLRGDTGDDLPMNNLKFGKHYRQEDDQ